MLFKHTATITTNAGGDATVYVGTCIRGCVKAILYQPGTLDGGADLTITGETNGQAILTKANAGTSNVWFYPVAPSSKVADGAASSITETHVPVFMERIKVVVAQGGNTLAGSISVFTDE